MPVFDHDKRTLRIAIALDGPPLAGKGTNLTHLHGMVPVEARTPLMDVRHELAQMLSMRARFASFATHGTYALEVEVRALRGPTLWDLGRRMVLHNADAVLVVLDSRRERMEANGACVDALRAWLEANGRDPARVPTVFQYNKRDTPGAVSIGELDARVLPGRHPRVPAVAARGEGVREALFTAVLAALAVTPKEPPA